MPAAVQFAIRYPFYPQSLHKVFFPVGFKEMKNFSAPFFEPA
jgi:hypothetical protein